jgi:hypothetical protein
MVLMVSQGADLDWLALFQRDKFQVGGQFIRVNGEERGRGHQVAQILQRVVVDRVADDAIAGHVHRLKKRKAHQVIPMGMGEEQVERALAAPELAAQQRMAERPDARPRVEHQRMLARGDFDAGGVAADHAANIERQARQVGPDRVGVAQVNPMLARARHRLEQLSGQAIRAQRRGQ